MFGDVLRGLIAVKDGEGNATLLREKYNLPKDVTFTSQSLGKHDRSNLTTREFLLFYRHLDPMVMDYGTFTLVLK
ncbi:hypothetical protein SLA2020_450550 [Shorea laevis]